MSGAVPFLAELRAHTGGTFDVFTLSGPSRAGARVACMSALVGRRVPQKAAGVNALRDALYSVTAAAGDCIAARDRHARAAALAILGGAGANVRAERAIAGARNQFRGLFRAMAADGCRYHVYAGSAGYIVAREDCEGLPELPRVVSDVQAMTEDRMAGLLFDDSRSRVFGDAA